MGYGILSALFWRERSGQGQEVEVDLMSGMFGHQSREMPMAMNFGRDFQRPSPGMDNPGMDAPFGVLPTSGAGSSMNRCGRKAERAGLEHNKSAELSSLFRISKE